MYRLLYNSRDSGVGSDGSGYEISDGSDLLNNDSFDCYCFDISSMIN